MNKKQIVAGDIIKFNELALKYIDSPHHIFYGYAHKPLIVITLVGEQVYFIDDKGNSAYSTSKYFDLWAIRFFVSGKTNNITV